MADIRFLAPFILSFEGGYSNRADDKGGPTNKGVTLTTYKNWCKEVGKPVPTINDLKSITDDEAIAIMKQKYWDRWRGDFIKDQSIANTLVDWTWGSGVWGIKHPQRILGVTQDGIVGPITIAALNSANPKELFDIIQTEREAFFRRIVARDSTQAVHLKGWLRRLNSIQYGKLLKNGGGIIEW